MVTLSGNPIKIENEKIKGSISLQGGIFDDLSFKSGLTATISIEIDAVEAHKKIFQRINY